MDNGHYCHTYHVDIKYLNLDIAKTSPFNFEDSNHTIIQKTFQFNINLTFRANDTDDKS